MTDTNLQTERGLELVWSVKPPWDQRTPLARKLRISDLLTQLLHNRGVSNLEAAQQFLQPSLGHLIEPERMVGIPPAAKRIRQALRDGEKIVLYGDYDVDGITGVAILWKCLQLAGTQVDYYVPHRLDEGYGLNAEAIRELAAKGTKLMVTVDCGVTAHEPAAVAAQLGVDLIITDHHALEGDLPQAVSVVHPNLPGQDYPNHDLCGAGVAFKLAWALAQEFSGSQKVSAEFREFLISATALAALGTIADVVPLQGENRILAYFGLQGLAGSTDQGVRALIQAAGLDGAKLQSADIGFRLAPRLNAAGRMGHARLAVELFTNSSAAHAAQIAGYLESQNNQRQKVEKEIAAEAIQQAAALGMDKSDWRGIVLAGENWHGGVVGIVASRVVDRYHRPTVVISRENDKAMGSGRSIEGFDICQALHSCSEYLLEFGGHSMAAGLKIDPARIEAFREAFNRYAHDHLSEQYLSKRLNIDAAVALADLDLKTVELIEKLGPFGQGNPPVKLLARNLKLVGLPQRMGKKADHLSFTVVASPAAPDHPNSSNPDTAGEPHGSGHPHPGRMMRAVAFGKARWEKKLIDAESFDLVFEPVVNRFNGNVTVELIAHDLKLH